MVRYLNLPGAAIVLTLMVAVSLYLATTFTFNTARGMGNDQVWFRAALVGLVGSASQPTSDL